MGVVQDYQQQPLRYQRAEQGRGLTDLARDLGRVNAQGAEHAAQRVQRVQAGGSALEVDIQLPVRELARGGELVGGVNGQGGLADPAHAVDRADHRRPGRPGGRIQQGDELTKLRNAAREVSDIGRQLTWDWETGTRAAIVKAGRLGVTGQNLQLQLLQFRSGIDAQLLGQRRASLRIDRQRLRLAAGLVQGAHLQAS